MVIANWTEADTDRAIQLWSEYQKQHDVSEKKGQTVGIDPFSGSIWFGDSIEDVVAQRNTAGKSAPMYFVRVGSDFYYRKGGHR